MVPKHQPDNIACRFPNGFSIGANTSSTQQFLFEINLAMGAVKCSTLFHYIWCVLRVNQFSKLNMINYDIHTIHKYQQDVTRLKHMYTHKSLHLIPQKNLWYLRHDWAVILRRPCQHIPYKVVPPR